MIGIERNEGRGTRDESRAFAVFLIMEDEDMGEFSK
jgi:hypothetical protein